MKYYYLSLLLIFAFTFLFNFFEVIKSLLEKNMSRYKTCRILSLISFLLFITIYILAYKK
ncbi:hypothetical protein AYJ08_02565 [Brevibacillus sp. SKDU10]|nr:hypothetical protein D8Z77_11610 [Brevibacillus laterosporus]ERM19788.1 hypothetical protein P615_09310 [Brevibacillus laterosporus PE36]OAJ76284.1 hypothetical protein AYJ08_02565 [Brevibacillus sp. SKDU10]PCN44921.1 hypothetical protein B9C88_06615 [Brevibacillus laterosporus]RFB33664.1 hypothetical protein DZB91_12975 [Brevibacillus sp. VP]